MGKKTPKCTKNGTLEQSKTLPEARQVVFYRSASGREPVRDWVQKLDLVSRKRIGGDLYTLQLGWPLGMPLAKKIEARLWEQRSKTVDGIARILFTESKGRLILLHGFVKKSRKIPASDLKLARDRLTTVKKGETT